MPREACTSGCAPPPWSSGTRQVSLVLVQPPGLHQGGAARRVAKSQWRERRDAICAEVAKAVAQLAPRSDHANALHECERERPDHAIGGGAGLVDIADPELVLTADGLGELTARARAQAGADR